MENIFSANVRGTREILKTKIVGIAGCGGLGSNAAIALARAGIGKLIIIDHDLVEISNLNRQYYFLDDIGKPKVEALREKLLKINPEIELLLYQIKLEPDDVPKIFNDADILIEAFDKAESKTWLIESWCINFPQKTIICGSGLAGIGKTDELLVKRAGNIIICGDEISNVEIGLCSARVAIVANMQANEAIEILVKGKQEKKLLAKN